MGYSAWGGREPDTTKRLTHTSYISETRFHSATDASEK